MLRDPMAANQIRPSREAQRVLDRIAAVEALAAEYRAVLAQLDLELMNLRTRLRQTGHRAEHNA
jgi:hypothetical protein